MSFSLVTILLIIHAACIAMVIIYCPTMFVVDKYQGGLCETRKESSSLGCEGCESSNCVTKSEGELVSLSSIMMSFKFPRDQTVNVWNWRMTASLSIYLRIYDNDLLLAPQDNTTEKLANIESFDQIVTLSSSLDYALNKNLAGDTSSQTFGSAWHSKARLRHENRTLRCRRVSEHEESETTAPELSFLCALSPVMELFPLSNSTYIASLQVERLVDTNPVINLVNTNATLVTYLSTVSESQRFHQVRFYTKCVFSPLILVSLVWFLVRLCMNDLYITIPDRLVITAALAHLINNLPLELVMVYLPFPHLLLAAQVKRRRVVCQDTLP